MSSDAFVAAAVTSSSPTSGAPPSPDPDAETRRPPRPNYGATGSTTPALHVQIATPEPSQHGQSGINGNGYSNYSGYDDDSIDDMEEIGGESLQMAQTCATPTRLGLHSLTHRVVPLHDQVLPSGAAYYAPLLWRPHRYRHLGMVRVRGANLTDNRPPSDDEEDEGQAYPHPFFWKAFLIGVFASFTVQSLRVPMFILSSWLPLSGGATVIVSTISHVIVHEACRLVSVPLTIPSPTSGFHSSFWLGLGWGAAETVWGIVQGYEQLSLYEDLSDPWVVEEIGDDCDDEERDLRTVPEDEALDPEDEAGANDDLAELEHRVTILERMRSRAGEWRRAMQSRAASLRRLF